MAGKRMFGDFNNDTKVDGNNNFRPGDYLVLMGEGKWIEDEYRYYKYSGVVVLTLEDMGDSQAPGDEVSHALFKRKKTSFFERDTKNLVRACENLPKDEANALREEQIWDYLVENQEQVGKIVHFKARLQPARAKKDATDEDENEGKLFLVVTPVRAYTGEELKAALKEASEKQRKAALRVLREQAPEGISEPAGSVS